MPIGPPTFLSNVLKLASGNVLAQGLVVLVAPILTRLFSPEAFGVAAVFFSVTAVIGVAACLRYELSVVLPDTIEEAANLFAVGLCTLLMVTAIIALAVFLSSDQIALLLNAPGLRPYLWLLPIAIFVNGLLLLLTYWNTRLKRFGRLSFARIIESAPAQVIKIVAGFAGYVTGGILIAANVFGSAVAAMALSRQSWREGKSLFREHIRWNKMTAGMKRHKRFPLYSTWSAVLDVSSRHLPVVLLAYFFSSPVVGFFALGRQVVSVPTYFFGEALAQVFLQKASEAKRDGQLGRVVDEVFRRLVSFSILPFFVLGVLGNDLFAVVFGDQWADAGVYIQILSVWLFFGFLARPLTALFVILEAQRTRLVYQVVSFCSRAVALVVGGLTGSPLIAISLFSVISAASSLWVCLWCFWRAGVRIQNPVAVLGRYLLFVSPLGILIWGMKTLMGPRPIATIAIVLGFSVIYYVAVTLTDLRLRHHLLALFREL